MGVLGALTSSYRQGVLNDFSSVVKAVFHIFKVKEASFVSALAGVPFDWEFVESLPVQLNPDDFTRSRSSQKHPQDEFTGLDLDNKSNKGYKIEAPRGNERGDVLMLNLDFDIYDEYNAVTMNGMIPPLGGKTSLSLTEKNVVIIEKLFYYSDVATYCALFRWGPTEFFGHISSLNCEYKCFSAYGEPLKAKVSVSLIRQTLGKDEKGIEKEINFVNMGVSLTDWEALTLSAKLDMATVAGFRVLEETNAMVMPTILREIKND